MSLFFRASNRVGPALIASLVAGYMGTSALTAHAQQAPASSQAAVAGFAEIIVTARRTEEKLQDVPIAIAVISGEDLIEQGIAKTSDLIIAVPGLTAAPGSGKGTDGIAYNLRGIQNRQPVLPADPSVGVYFAEVPLAVPIGANANFLDLQSVQVLFGPQGTLFGRNSPAGAILITPNAPTQNLEGYGQISGGNYGYYMIEGVLNTPITDKLAIRLAGQREKRDGYSYSVGNGQQTDDLNNYSFRFSAKYDPSDNFTTTLVAYTYDSNTSGTGYRMTQIAPLPGPPNYNFATYSNYLALSNALPKYHYYGVFSDNLAKNTYAGVSLFDGWKNGNRNYSDVSLWGIQDTSVWDLGESDVFGEVSLKNIIGYRDMVSSNIFAQVAAEAPISMFIDLTQNAKQFTEELQVQGKKGGLTYIVGAFFFRQSGLELSPSAAAAAPTTVTMADLRMVGKSYAGFGHITYDFGELGLEGLQLDGGFRYTHDRRDIVFSYGRRTTPGYSANPLYNCIYYPTRTSVPISSCSAPFVSESSSPTWNINLNYKITPTSMVYASIGRGYRTGGYDVIIPTTDTVPYKPEYVTSYEIGTKNDFIIGDVPVRFNAAAYYSDYKDIQRSLSALLPSGSTTNYTVNAAAARIRGAEVTFQVQPTENLTTTLTMAYTEPKYKSFSDNYREANPAFFPAGTPAGTTFVLFPVDVSDSHFPIVSKNTMSASLVYRLPVSESAGEPSVTVNYYNRTGFFSQSDLNTSRCKVPGNNNPAAVYNNCYNSAGRLPGYHLVNARLDWRDVMQQGFDLSFFVNNVTDEYYGTYMIGSLSNFGMATTVFGPPRMFGATLRVPFGN
jgi:iron complex outermembrane receptor protein